VRRRAGELIELGVHLLACVRELERRRIELPRRGVAHRPESLDLEPQVGVGPRVAHATARL